jgi:hypothetical protein
MRPLSPQTYTFCNFLQNCLGSGKNSLTAESSAPEETLQGLFVWLVLIQEHTNQEHANQIGRGIYVAACGGQTFLQESC